MLSLMRRVNESIIIGEKEVKITILEVRGKHVKIGIEADKDIPINREEVYRRILNEKKMGE